MRCSMFSISRLISAIVVLFTLTTFAAPSRADEPIRWKFKVGEKLAHSLALDTELALNMGSSDQRNMTVRQVMDMTWDVQGVNDQGEAVIEINFDRVQMKVDGGPMTVDFDTAKDTPATGMAVTFGPAYKALTKSPTEITMTARGEIKDVKVPPEVLDALKSSPGAAQLGDLATPEGFQKFFLQGLFTLPEQAPKQGDHWTTTITNNNSIIGNQKGENTYTYDGTKQVGGETMAVFHPTMTVHFDGTPQMQLKVKNQKSDGEILFNEQQGRLESMSVKQDMTLDVTVASQMMQQQISQTFQVKFGQKDAESPAPSSNAPASGKAEN
jgi:hypothetical protein